MTGLRQTPLHATHVRLGGRMVEFAGFSMPVQYTSILDEHAAVRERAGLFDVSHMGQIHFEGPTAVADVERLVTCPVASLRAGRVRYGLMCNEDGGVVDDVTVYRIAEDALMLCVNAANIDKDHEWACANTPSGRAPENRSDATGLLALQGPLSLPILKDLTDADPGTLRRFGFRELDVAGGPSLVSRTGYTGSDGFELYVPADRVETLFAALLEKGEARGLQPAGLGARDTLRLEAAMALYGHELDDTTSPLEAGLDRFVKREIGGFIGAEAIEARAAAGHPRALVGFEVDGRGIARAEYAIHADGQEVGIVTSGAPSPTLGKPIGLGYVQTAVASVGTPIEILVRGRGLRAHIVETPFVRAGGRA
jgi:aminomethyltransferase